MVSSKSWQVSHLKKWSKLNQNTKKQNTEDKKLIPQAKWGIVEGGCEVIKINHGFCVWFVSFGSFLDWLQVQPERSRLVQISASLRGTVRRTRRCRITGLTAELAQSLRDSLFLSISSWLCERNERKGKTRLTRTRVPRRSRNQRSTQSYLQETSPADSRTLKDIQ